MSRSCELHKGGLDTAICSTNSKSELLAAAESVTSYFSKILPKLLNIEVELMIMIFEARFK